MSRREDPLRPLREDTRSGATELARRAARILAEQAEEDPAGVGETARRLRRLRPSMAPLCNVAHAVLQALERKEDPAAAASTVETRLQRAGPRIARAAREPLLGAGTLLVFSWSSTVLRCLQALEPVEAPPILVAESRPECEGRRTATALAEHGHRVVLVTEAGLGPHLAEDLLFLTGADALYRDGGIANKVGTRLLAAGVREAGGQVLVVSTLLKARYGWGWDREGLDPEQVHEEPRDPERVWSRPPEGIRVENPTFEKVPPRLLDRILTEEGDPAPPSGTREASGASG